MPLTTIKLLAAAATSLLCVAFPGRPGAPPDSSLVRNATVIPGQPDEPGALVIHAPSTYVIRNVTVIDVERGRAVPARSVFIQDSHISLVMPDESSPPPGAYSDAKTIDAKGLFLIPGLFDAHVHYVSPETYGPLFIAHGVTFVRDMAGATDQVTALRDRLNKGEEFGPEMICTGAIIDGDPPVWPFSEPCTTPEQARAAVKKLKDAGVNMIKVYSRLKPEVYRAAVEEAHAQGLKAVGHVPESVNLDIAMEVKQDSNEHLMGFEKLIAKLVPAEPTEQEKRAGIWAGMFAWNRLPKADRPALQGELKKIAASGMVQCPTVVVMAGIGSLATPEGAKDPRLDYVPVEIRSFWGGEMYAGFARFAGGNVPHLKAMLGELHKAGVPLMIGTDLANPNVFAGASVHDEMKIFADAGIPNADILRSATIIPAKFCGVDSKVGTIAPGKTASLVLLAANPLDDIANTTKIKGVFLRGKYFDRAALDGLLKGVHSTVAASKPTEQKIVFELPGEVIAKGTYAAKFGPYDAGSEDFLITKDQDGYHLMAHSQPKGGPQKPFVVTAHYGPDFAFRSAVKRELTQAGFESTYTRDGNAITAKAKSAGEEPAPQKIDFPPDAVFSLPVYAGDFVVALGQGLKPGDSKTVPAFTFGYASWEAVSNPLSITRGDDTTLTRAGGAETKARFYTTELKTPIGAFKGQVWTDERSVVLKSVTVMPFGTISAELK